MTTLTEGKHVGGFLVWEVLRDYTREAVTIASGAGKLEPGTVLGKITTGGKYTGLAPAATNGSTAQNTQCHDRFSLSQAATAGPTKEGSIQQAEYHVITLARSAGS